MRKKFLTNLMYAFSAQGISMILSFVMSLIVPKMLNVTEYSYWQLFLFYCNYVGVFHFGLNDGIYLKYGGVPYDKLEKKLLGMQYWLGTFIQILVAIVIVLIGKFTMTDSNRFFVCICVAIYMIVFNMSWFLGYIFQASNETKWYSISVVIEKIGFIIFIIILLTLEIKQFEYYVLFYLLAKVFSYIYCIIKGRDITFLSGIHFQKVIKEWFANVKIGIHLMIASLISMFILGSGRLIIDKVWGIEAFGKISFSITLSSFILAFVSQTSMVMFPTLRGMKSTEQEKIYGFLRNVLAVVLPATFILYYPIKWVISIWLPQYTESLKYLAFMIPLCTYDARMNLLCNTYMKVFRKEKELLRINVLAVITSIISSVVGAYLIHNIYAVVIGMVISIMIRSVVAEFYVAKIMKNNIARNIITEFVFSIVFIGIANFMQDNFACVVTTILFICYLFINRTDVKALKKIFVLIERKKKSV